MGLTPGIGFKLQYVFQGALRALDLRAEYRLVTHVHGDEEIWVGKNRGNTIQSPQAPVCIGKQSDQVLIRPDRGIGGSWAGMKARYPSGCGKNWPARMLVLQSTPPRYSIELKQEFPISFLILV